MVVYHAIVAANFSSVKTQLPPPPPHSVLGRNDKGIYKSLRWGWLYYVELRSFLSNRVDDETNRLIIFYFVYDIGYFILTYNTKQLI